MIRHPVREEPDCLVVRHPQAGAQDGDESDAGGDFDAFGFFQRRLVPYGAQRKIGGGLIDHERGQLVDELAKEL